MFRFQSPRSSATIIAAFDHVLFKQSEVQMRRIESFFHSSPGITQGRLPADLVGYLLRSNMLLLVLINESCVLTPAIHDCAQPSRQSGGTNGGTSQQDKYKNIINQLLDIRLRFPSPAPSCDTSAREFGDSAHCSAQALWTRQVKKLALSAIGARLWRFRGRERR